MISLMVRHCTTDHVRLSQFFLICDFWRVPSRRGSTFVLLIGHVLEPLHGFAVDRFLNRNVRYRDGWGRAMPMLFTGRKPNNIARLNLFHRPALALRPTNARGDDQRLTERMRVPRRARTRVERNTRPAHPRWLRRFE